MSFATPQDLVDRWRPLSPSEMARAGTLLEDAADLIRSEFRRAGWTIDERITAGAVTDRDLLAVSVDMVKRVLMASVDHAPMAQVQQTAGPFSQSGTFVNPTGDLYLIRRDRRRLGLGGQVAFTVPMGSVSVLHKPWCSLHFGATYCDCGAVA